MIQNRKLVKVSTVSVDVGSASTFSERLRPNLNWMIIRIVVWCLMLGGPMLWALSYAPTPTPVQIAHTPNLLLWLGNHTLALFGIVLAMVIATEVITSAERPTWTEERLEEHNREELTQYTNAPMEPLRVYHVEWDSGMIEGFFLSEEEGAVAFAQMKVVQTNKPVIMTPVVISSFDTSRLVLMLNDNDNAVDFISDEAMIFKPSDNKGDFA